MSEAKNEGLCQNSDVTASASVLTTKKLTLAKNQVSLVPHYKDSSDSSSDENRGLETREYRKKTLSSPRKRKKTLGRCNSAKLFSDSNEETFNGCFPTTSDGSIDMDSLFNPNDNTWTEKLCKMLQQFPNIPDIKTCSTNDNSEEPVLSDSEYEIDLSSLELVPVLIKQKKRVIVSSNEHPDEERASSVHYFRDSLSDEPSIASDNPNEDVFAKPKLKPKCRKFIFKPFLRQPDGTLSHDEHKSPVEIIIPEQLAASYGLYIWPCSPVLAWYIWLHQNKFQHKKVLELGSGTALPGLLCAKMGARKVWLSDDSSQPKTLNNCKEAVRMNGLEDRVDVIGLTWGEYTKNLTQFRNNKLDYVVGSDLFFDPKVFEPLIKTLSYLLSIKNDTEIYITVQERSTDWTLEEHLNKWNLCCDYIFPKEFLKGTGIDESDLIGGHTIFILRIFKK